MEQVVKRILIYGNRKSDPTYWDVSTPELERAAMVELFDIIDDWGVYCNIADDSEFCEEAARFKELQDIQVQLDAGTIPAPLIKDAQEKVRNLRTLKWEMEDWKENIALYALAQDGDVSAIIRLLKSRRGNEYEKWSIEEVRTPASIESANQ